MKYHIPILLQNINIESLTIDRDIKIRNITLKEREDLFGIKDIKFGFFKNHTHIDNIKISEKNGRYSYRNFHMKEILESNEHIFASNYIIESDVDCMEEVDKICTDINISFNLLSPTNTKCRLGFKEGETDVSFFGNQNYKKCSFGPLFLEEDDISKLISIYKKVKNLNSKEKLKFDLFMDGLHNETSLELKFLSLVIALENMFLPDEGAELMLRFSLRVAGFVEELAGENKKDIFELAKNIYNARSKIVHEGASSKLTEDIYFKTVNLTRISLKEYLSNQSKFKKDHLNSFLI